MTVVLWLCELRLHATQWLVWAKITSLSFYIHQQYCSTKKSENEGRHYLIVIIVIATTISNAP